MSGPGLVTQPIEFRLRGGRGSVALHESGIRHPASVFSRRETFTDYRDITHIADGAQSLRLANSRSVYILPRSWFTDPDGADRLLVALRGRIFRQPGGSEQLQRMNDVERLSRASAAPLLATRILAFACVVAYVLMWLRGPIFFEMGFMNDVLVDAGETWRLVTANLVHWYPGFPYHLALNVLGILALGSFTERALGSGRTWFVLAVSGLVATWVSGWVGPVKAFGASGMVFGLVGALLWLEFRCVAELPAGWRVPRGLLLGALAVDLLIGAVVPFVGGAAHVGGLVAGVGAGALVARGGLRREPTPRLLALTNAATLALVFLSVFAMGRALVGDPGVLAKRGQRLLEHADVPPVFLNNYAWFIATEGQPDPREVDVALTLAERAVEATESLDPNSLDTLAELQYLAGFEERAVKTIERAIQLAPGVGYFREQKRRFTGEREWDDRPEEPQDPELPMEPERLYDEQAPAISV